MDLIIQPVPQPRRLDALKMLSSHDAGPSAAEIAAILLAHGPSSCEGLIEALRGDTRVGVAWSHLLAEDVASVIPPRTHADESREVSQRLLAATEAFLRGQRVSLAQAILPAMATGRDAETLAAAGYTHAADLAYMICSRDRFPNEPATTPFKLDAYTAQDRTRLARLVDRTYEGTLDCPTLNGLRTTDAVLAGYERSGDAGTSLWQIATDGGADIGCLLLSDFPRQDQWELNYMGLVSEARGRGWGRDLVQQSLWQARNAGRGAVVLGVDRANHPAVAMYQACGFDQWDCRAVWLRELSDRSDPPSP